MAAPFSKILFCVSILVCVGCLAGIISISTSSSSSSSKPGFVHRSSSAKGVASGFIPVSLSPSSSNFTLSNEDFIQGISSGFTPLSPSPSFSSNFSFTSKPCPENSCDKCNSEGFIHRSWGKGVAGNTMEIYCQNKTLSTSAGNYTAFAFDVSAEGLCTEYSGFESPLHVCEDCQASDASPSHNVGQVLFAIGVFAGVPAFVLLMWGVIKLVEWCKDHHHRRARLGPEKGLEMGGI